jgi:hypothetical protein
LARRGRAATLIGCGVLIGALLTVPCTAAIAGAAPTELVPVSVTGIDSVRRRPGVNWSVYDAVLVAPVKVSFSTMWDPRDYGRFGLRPRDVERIRSKVAALAHATFVKVLTEGGYRVVDRADAGVLQIEPNIIDLYVNAPDLPDENRHQSYVLEAGETGTLLAEARDRQRGIDRGRFTVANSVTNRAEAERVLRRWATLLRDSLDAARQGR